ncbi:MAG: 4Fe-4S single cluster domain of Ferredoxin [Brevundimonas sp.]|nr:4Fe-4S single cluster domain of Ferredoxin [Brevundimonas sp.]
MDHSQTPPVTHIAVDPALCTASGVCVATAPSLFALASGAYCATVIIPYTDDLGLIDAATEAAALCPTGAIGVAAAQNPPSEA